jgi:hypothetical protein
VEVTALEMEANSWKGDEGKLQQEAVNVINPLDFSL